MAEEEAEEEAEEKRSRPRTMPTTTIDAGDGDDRHGRASPAGNAPTSLTPRTVLPPSARIGHPRPRRWTQRRSSLAVSPTRASAGSASSLSRPVAADDWSEAGHPPPIDLSPISVLSALPSRTIPEAGTWTVFP